MERIRQKQRTGFRFNRAKLPFFGQGSFAHRFGAERKAVGHRRQNHAVSQQFYRIGLFFPRGQEKFGFQQKQLVFEHRERFVAGGSIVYELEKPQILFVRL